MGARRVRAFVWMLAGACLLTLPAAAHAAFPGQNGRIAFTKAQPNGASDIYSVEPSGVAEARLTEDGLSANAAFSPDGLRLAYSSGTRIYVADQYANDPQLVLDTTGVGEIDWSPDGTQLVAALANCAEFDCEYDVYVFGIDGSGLTNLTNSLFSEVNPSWAPDGSKIVYDSGVSGDQDVYVMNPDGTGVENLTSDYAPTAAEPDWLPDGSKIAFESSSSNTTTMNPDGTGKSAVGGGINPAWSPDGSTFAFVSGNFVRVNGPQAGPHGLIGAGDAPDWQVRPPDPVPPPGGGGYPRPKGATPLFVPLVPTYARCTSPSMQHGPPLAYPSCAPQRLGFRLTVGTPDANGQPAEAAGSVRFDSVLGNPTTPADEADVWIGVNQTDVKANSPATGYTDYLGELMLVIPLRATDRFNAGGGTDGSATVVDFPLYVEIPCSATPDSVGSTCAVSTTVDAVVPGFVREGERSVWQAGQLVVQWEGLDQDPNTLADNRPFLTQGVFVP